MSEFRLVSEGHQKTVAGSKSENGHPALIFAVSGIGPNELTDESLLKHNIFRERSKATGSHVPQYIVNRSQTFDSTCISQRHPSTPLRMHSLSYETSQNKSPTFPFRPNAALRSYQMTQLQINASFDEQMQSATKNGGVLSCSSSEEISVVTETTKHKQHFPVKAIPLEGGNWWLDETTELTRQMNQNLSQAVANTTCEYIEHIVLPTDTIQGICLAYKVSAMRLKKENGFSGNNLQLGPKILRVPVNTNYGMNLQRRACSPSTVSSGNSFGGTQAIKTDDDITNQKLNSSLMQQFSDDKSHYSQDDMLILEDIMQKLKIEMEQADDLAEQKKSELKQLLNRLESTLSQENMWEVANNVDPKASIGTTVDNTTTDTYESLRKPLVAAAGGTLVTAGAILVPVPIIPGALVIYAGLSVLATEFEVANQALDKMREPLKEILAHEQDRVIRNDNAEIDSNLTSWTDLIPKSQNAYLHHTDIDKEFSALMHVTVDPNSVEDNFDDAARKAKNEMKRWARNLLNLETADEGLDPAVDKINSTPCTNRSLLKRFDSLLSSYVEEVDENGVASNHRL